MVVTSAYPLPFRVVYPSGAMSSGRPLELTIEVERASDAERVRRHVLRFAALSATGALAGATIPPWDSEWDVSQIAIHAERIVRVSVARSRVADEGLVVLAHLLLATHHRSPIRRVEVESGDRRNQVPLQSNPDEPSSYPTKFAHLPFVVEDTEPEGGSYSFHGELAGPLSTDQERALNGALASWIRCVRQGGFALAPLDPRRCYVEPDSDAVTTFDAIVEWAVFKLSADSACIGSLVNVFGAFHGRHQRLVRLVIE